MMNLVAALKALLHGLMKMAGIRHHTIEIEPGTVMSIWVPSETIQKPKKSKTTEAAAPANTTAKPTKPVVVLVHGFAAEGILTWQFQVGSLTKTYSVYVPDLLFFGDSITESPDRSPRFQAEFLAKGLRKLGIEKCTVVGFSYGGMVAFKMAELYPDLVEALVVSGSILALTDSICHATLSSLGFNSLAEFLLPTTVKGCRELFGVATHMQLWFPDRFHKDFIKAMFNNRKKREELLEGLMVSNKDTNITDFPQKIHLLWGENDRIFKMEVAKTMKEQFGENATVEGIEKAGHLVHLERPCVYNRCLNKFLASLHAHANKAKFEV